MNFFKRSDPQPPSTVATTARDVEAANKLHRDHVVASISVHVSMLVANGWIADQTVQMLTSELRTHGMELNLDAHITRGDSQPPQYQPQSSSKSGGPPPLPSRLPNNNNSAPSAAYKPTPNPSPIPPSLPLRKPSIASNVSSFTPTPHTSGSYASNLASNPAFQKAAFNAAKDPGVQAAASSAARDPGVQKAMYAAASTAYSQKSGAGGFAGSLASNPAFQKAAASAATDPRVQSAAFNAAKDPAVSKAVFGGIGASLNANVGNSRRDAAVVVAIADFDATEPDDLPLRTGDVITVLEDIDENWYRGESKNGRRGMFPKNHVESR
ncbi:hypothetical protein HDU81_005687 [Chytriomyces hyalinus]|nr:hypothetical protein HDU81_005687 [Chytriomyces hyalinus]